MTQPFSGSTNAITPQWMNSTAQDQFNSIIRELGDEGSKIYAEHISSQLKPLLLPQTERPTEPPSNGQSEPQERVQDEAT